MRRHRFMPVSGLAALLLAASAQAQPVTLTGTGFPIPDNLPAGASSTIAVPNSFTPQSVTVTLDFSAAAGGVRHTWLGDLIGTLQHGATVIDLFRRAGKSVNDGSDGDSSNFLGIYTFTDAAANRIIDVAGGLPGANDATGDLPNGNYRATTNTFNGVDGTGTPPFSGETAVSLNSSFGGQNVSGNWTLTLIDGAANDIGTLGSWSITLAPAAVPEPSALALLGLAAASGLAGRWRWRRPFENRR
jgi:hypothetical protein